MASIVPIPFNDEESDLNLMSDETHDQRLLIGIIITMSSPYHHHHHVIIIIIRIRAILGRSTSRDGEIRH